MEQVSPAPRPRREITGIYSPSTYINEITYCLNHFLILIQIFNFFFDKERIVLDAFLSIDFGTFLSFLVDFFKKHFIRFNVRVFVFFTTFIVLGTNAVYFDIPLLRIYYILLNFSKSFVYVQHRKSSLITHSKIIRIAQGKRLNAM